MMDSGEQSAVSGQRANVGIRRRPRQAESDKPKKITVKAK